MRISLILSILLLLAFCTTHGQVNLVPNPSFEDSDSCPQYNGNLFCTPWYSPTNNTPDYFHPCWNGWWLDTMDVPVNLVGYQWPHTGIAYAGFGGIYSTPNGREYISVKLMDTLEPGMTYCVEFFVSLADESWGGINYIGAHFSPTPDTAYAGFFLGTLPYQPQVEISYPIVDTVNWIRIADTIIATGTECYFTVGVFKPDSVLTYDSLQGDGSSRGAYYFIDDVSVTSCDPPTYNEIQLFPNPSNGEFTITGNFPPHTQLIMYNLLGQKVLESPYLPEGNNSVPVQVRLAQGVYYYELRSTEKLAEGKLLIVD